MSTPVRHRSRRPNATGRSRRNGEPFVMLRRHVMRSAAYKSLNAHQRGVYMELKARFNGLNNGNISCSLRELAKELHCSKDTASKALAVLEDRGFIKCAQPGSFHFKIEHAPLWILTEEELNGRAATKEFMSWAPSKEKCGPKTGTRGPGKRTETASSVASEQQTVPVSGPTREIDRRSRS